MASITGIGGAFLRVSDPEALYQWYEQHLGLKREHGCFTFEAEAHRGSVVLAFFKKEGVQSAVNLQVNDLDAILDDLQAAGVEVDPKREDYGFGKFGWFTDPEGNRVELWQPVD